MPVARYQLPDGRVARFEVPEGTTPEQAQQIGQDYFASPQPANKQQAQPGPASDIPAPDDYMAGVPALQASQEQGIAEQAVDVAGNVLAGGVRGAGSIGATILAPYDIIKDAVSGKGLSLESNRERRAAMDAALQSMGADPESIAYKGGKIATEIAGTLPVGGLLGKGAGAAGASPKVVSALSSGGLKLGTPAATTLGGRAADMALRTGSGALTGGVTAGIIDPEQADTGALVGGAMPGGIQAAGAAGKAINRAAGSMFSNLFGTTTGAGADAIKVAFEAGKRGSREFLDNMRGNAGFDDIVDSAKTALGTMRLQRQAVYRAGMDAIKKDKTVLAFDKIDDAMKSVVNTGSFKGVPIRRKAAETVDELGEIVSAWKQLDPAEYHTPEGFDALKQAIGDIRDSTQFGTPARRAADQLYNSVKAEINKQAPEYAKVMKDYSRASELLTELEKSLSASNKAARDTTVRKLQSVMRNNAQTNYGNRLQLVKKLEEQGGVELMPALAGQSLSSATPRGMVGALEKAGALGGASLVAGGYLNPATLALLPAASPRLVGEAAYGLGRVAGVSGSAAKTVSNQLLNLASKGDTEALNALLSTAPVVSSINR